MMQPASWTIFASAIAIAWQHRTSHIGESSLSEAYLPPPPENLGPSKPCMLFLVCHSHDCVLPYCRLNVLLGRVLAP
jgi:hypothetical protein